MVLGYMCETHGYVSECDVSESGERICYECGMAVTGLVGHTRGRRAPPSDDPSFQNGDIQWVVKGTGVRLTVMAFDHREALAKADEEVDNPQAISEVKPAKREYRH